MLASIGLGGTKVVGNDVSWVFVGDGAAVSLVSGGVKVVGAKVSDCVGSALTMPRDGAPVGMSTLPRGQTSSPGGSSRVK